jgi:hypothetical protein
MPVDKLQNLFISKKKLENFRSSFFHLDKKGCYPLNTPILAYLSIRAFTNSFGDNFFNSS